MPNDIAEARQLIDKNSDSGGLNVNALCHELSQKVMQWTYTVFEVFNVLTERGFDQASHEQVAINLISRINRGNLIQLAQSRHGWILLERIWLIMNCGANSGQQICQIIANAVAQAKEIERETTPRQLSKEEMDFYATLNTQDGVLWERNAKTQVLYRIDYRKDFKPDVCWDLPAYGTGFITYTPDDLDNKDADRKTLGEKRGWGFDQIGTKETIESIIKIGQAWAGVSNQKLQIGDISRPGGINTPDHATHNTGKAFDMRPLRKSDAVASLKLDTKGNHPDYDRKLTIDFILLVRRLYPTNEFLFNDPEILKDGKLNSFIRYAGGHYDHLHVMFPGGKE